MARTSISSVCVCVVCIAPVPMHTTVSPYQPASATPFYLQPTTMDSSIVGHNFPEAQRGITQLFKGQGFKVDSPKSKGSSLLKSCSFSQVSEDGKLEPGRCHRSWHVFLSCLLVLHKGAGTIVTTQTILSIRDSRKIQAWGLGRADPTLAPGCRAVRETAQQSMPIFVLAPPPWPLPCLPGPSPKIQALDTTGSWLCKQQGLNEWRNLKWLQLGPRV